MSAGQPRIWVLLGHRTGDNNQLLALAEALKLPFETRTLHFNALRVLHRWIGASQMTLDRKSRQAICPPWPDLVIGIGWRSVAVARWIKKASGGRARLVRLGDPRSPSDTFDLIVTTPQYPVADAPNVLRLPLGMSRFRTPPDPTETEKAVLDALQRPHRLMAVGGPAKYWQLSAQTVISAAQHLNRPDGSLIIAASPRTPPDIIAALEHAKIGTLVKGREPRFAVLLSDADEIFVTGDSIAMLSEAVLSGKPVGIVPIEMSGEGHRVLGTPDSANRDLRRFWSTLRKRGLAGTIDRPVAGQLADPAGIAADAVRALLGDRVQ
ncbi:MAG TPA: ELM1/GtrOC1 family putative glycosyltransferase [Sphingomicrobium sp.]